MLLLVSAVLCACKTPSATGFDHPGQDLPTNDNALAKQALNTLRQRDTLMPAWRATGSITLSTPDTDIRLDGVMIADRLDRQQARMRLRATKLGRIALDLVVDSGGAYLWVRSAGDDDADNAGLQDIRLPPLQLYRDKLELNRATAEHDVYDTSWPADARTPAQAWVHRATATLHRITLDTPEGPVNLAFRYRPGEPAPHLDALRLTAPGGTAMRFEVDRFQSNPALTDAQFVPVPGSTRIGERP